MNRTATAIWAALVALPLTLVPALAQQDGTATDTGTQDVMDADGQSDGQVSSDGGAQDTGGAGEGMEGGTEDGAGDGTADGTEDGAQASGEGAQTGAADGATAMSGRTRPVAKVGDVTVTEQDVIETIQNFPVELAGQPPQALVQLAVEQLVLRQVILNEARESGLAEDPQVQEVMSSGQVATREDAIVRVFVLQALEGVVSDESVQAAYDEAAANSPGDAPPMADVRPQLEQQIRQRRLTELRNELIEGADITYFGPDGEVVARTGAQDGAEGGTDGEGGDAMSGEDGDATGDAAGGEDGGDASSGSDAAGGAAEDGGEDGGEDGTEGED